MNYPDAEDVESDFQVLDTDYGSEEFYGGAFEGSHVFGDMVILRLYSIVFDPDPVLRIETRYHYLGSVLEHRQSDVPLDEDRTLPDYDGTLEAFCRAHHFADPRAEIVDLIDGNERELARP